MFNAKQTQNIITNYIQTIGDIQQKPPGVEDALDPLLKRDISEAGVPDFSQLPGNIHNENILSDLETSTSIENLSLQEKRILAQNLLQKKI